MDEKIEILCKEIGSNGAIKMFEKQLKKAKYYYKKSETDKRKEQYLQCINRLTYAIHKAKELNFII